MLRSILVYGAISGSVVIAVMIAGMTLGGGYGAGSMVVGYLVMLIALSLIFIAVKRHRDRELGGVIRFWPALGMGLGIAAVAGVAYVIVWEIHLAATDYAFMTEYAAASIERQRAAGVTGTELDAHIASMADMQENYANPLFRLPMTFLEIFPVGLIIALISAALLRNPKFAPRRAAS